MARRLGWLLINGAQAIFLGVWSAFWITAALLALVVTFRRDLPLHMARTCWAPGLLWIGGARLVVEGGESIDWSRPHIFLMNHQSAIDIPVAFRVLKTPLRFIAKRVLAKVPFIGWYMWATGMIFIDRQRSTRAMESLRKAGERIRAGASILAYPEGTRSRNGRIQPFKRGAFALAIEAQVPIVPVAIAGADRVLSSTGFRVRPGTIRVRIGEPIPTTGLTRDDRDELMYRVHDAIVDMHLAIGGAGGPRMRPTAAGERDAADAEPPARKQSA